jgi:hypothetical protein
MPEGQTFRHLRSLQPDYTKINVARTGLVRYLKIISQSLFSTNFIAYFEIVKNLLQKCNELSSFSWEMYKDYSLNQNFLLNSSFTCIFTKDKTTIQKCAYKKGFKKGRRCLVCTETMDGEMPMALVPSKLMPSYDL